MQDVGFYLTAVLFSVMGGVAVFLMPLWLLLTIFTPRSLLENCFKEPHFTLSETIMMARYPGSLLRTSIFGWTLIRQPFGFKSFRNLDGMRDAMPTWYAYGLYILIYCNIISIILMVVLFSALSVLTYFLDK